MNIDLKTWEDCGGAVSLGPQGENIMVKADTLRMVEATGGRHLGPGWGHQGAELMLAGARRLIPCDIRKIFVDHQIEVFCYV